MKAPPRSALPPQARTWRAQASSWPGDSTAHGPAITTKLRPPTCASPRLITVGSARKSRLTILKLLDIVEIGKQMLITRGSLTTFSIANDIAKYFAIIPAMFAGAIPALDSLNVMQLGSPRSAILAAVIFNALVIVALIPLALRGVSFRPASAAAMLRRNLLIYGAGGMIAPFVGIKLIDLVIGATRSARRI